MAYLQRPGGNGPLPKMTPLGSKDAATTQLPSSPAMYHSSNTAVTGLRGLDNINRVITQYEVDTGKYQRPAVGTTNYQLGNIMPSQETVGVAGYNQAGKMVMPGKAADRSHQQFLLAEANNLNPALRQQVAMATSVPKQNFFNDQNTSTYPLINYNMPDNLYMPGAVEGKKDA